MRRRFSWITVAIATMAVTVVFVTRPIPVPATPPPVRLEGELLMHTGTPNGLVVVPNPTIQLSGDTSPTIDNPDGFDSAATAASMTASAESFDSDSLDSPDG